MPTMLPRADDASRHEWGRHKRQPTGLSSEREPPDSDRHDGADHKSGNRSDPRNRPPRRTRHVLHVVVHPKVPRIARIHGRWRFRIDPRPRHPVPPPERDCQTGNGRCERCHDNPARRRRPANTVLGHANRVLRRCSEKIRPVVPGARCRSPIAPKPRRRGRTRRCSATRGRGAVDTATTGRRRVRVAAAS